MFIILMMMGRKILSKKKNVFIIKYASGIFFQIRYLLYLFYGIFLFCKSQKFVYDLELLFKCIMIIKIV